MSFRNSSACYCLAYCFIGVLVGTIALLGLNAASLIRIGWFVFAPLGVFLAFFAVYTFLVTFVLYGRFLGRGGNPYSSPEELRRACRRELDDYFRE